MIAAAAHGRAGAPRPAPRRQSAVASIADIGGRSRPVITGVRPSSGTRLATGRFTCADIAVASALTYAQPARMPLDDHPTLRAWFYRIAARPSSQATQLSR